jgi:putative ABC transport system substrate-binding protein
MRRFSKWKSCMDARVKPAHDDLRFAAIQIKRRDVIGLLGVAAAAAAWPAAARAQSSDRVRRVGVLIQLAESDPEGQARLAAFREELQKLGWRIGNDLQIDYRWGISNDERARAAIAELLNLAPAVILANSTVSLRAAQQATRTVPIVFTTVIEPVAEGFVASLARPGANTTGFSYLELSIGGKWLDLLKEIAPIVTRIALMFNPQRGPYSVGISHFVQQAAQNHAVQYVAAPVNETTDIETVMTTLAREPGGGLIVSPDAFTVTHAKVIIALAARYGLPAIYGGRSFAANGGLISYGANYVDHFRQAATYVDRILRGEKPADLPVQQPSRFELVINVRTAKALGLDIPPMLLARADEVIE